jgi:arabinan endo-1,5-alpha-L-arabinosidase
MRACWAAALAALLAGCVSVPEPIYTNPVLERDFPDPAVLRAPDGWFYAYGTQSEAGNRMLNLQVARSRDLARWEHLGDALPVKPSWGATKQVFWAPHVIEDRGTFFMYYSAERDDAKGKCLAVATARAPAGPFTDSGAPLLCGTGIEHIDPMAFDDPRSGRRLLYWGSGPILVQELAPDRLRFAPGSEPRALLQREPQRPYRRLIEGAWVVLRGGYYYLFFSGDRCCDREPRYAVMVARARDPLGPFEQRDAPILEAGGGWLAPGHNSVIEDTEGIYWLLYHAMREPPKRLMLLDRITWRDGWPRLAGDVPSSTPTAAPRLQP